MIADAKHIVAMRVLEDYRRGYPAPDAEGRIRVPESTPVLFAFLIAFMRGNQLILGENEERGFCVYEVPQTQHVPEFLRPRLDS